MQDSQHEKIAQAKARVDAQQAEVDRLQDQLEEHTIRAPFDGYVTKEHTQQGEWLAKGDPVVELVELKEVDVEAAVPEEYFSQVHVGMEARVTIAALPGQSWDDRVELIVPQADVRSRSFPVKVRLENPPERLLFKPGMFARVTLPVGSKQMVLLVAKDAVVLGGESPVVYVVDPIGEAPAPPSKGPPAEGPGPPTPSPDGVARLVPVELGALVDDLVEVRGPAIEVGKALKPGDHVVVEGNERLSPGCPLMITNRDWPRSKRPAAKPSK
jgi:multidrug efflux pump subunit AcrA (membrane-fusion protein)